MSKSQHPLRYISLFCFLFLSTFLLAACNGIDPTGGDTPFTGDGEDIDPLPFNTTTEYSAKTYSISYLKEWDINEKTDGIVFSEAGDNALVTFVKISSSRDNGSTPVQMLEQAIKGPQGSSTNVQPVSVPDTITINGTTWQQKAFTGITKTSDKLAYKMFVAVTIKNGNTFVVYRSATPDAFESQDTQVFKPMLWSFKAK